MASDFNWEEIDVSEVVEGLTAVLLAPIVLPIAAGMNQPLAKTLLKEGLAFSQRCKEAVADARERFEDLLAEAKAEVDEEQQAPADGQMVHPGPLRPTHIPAETSQVTEDLLNAASELNARVHWLTNGAIDLQILMPLGLSALALRQIFVQGLQFDRIPWYNLAWYAYDSFTKLDRPHSQSLVRDEQVATLEVQEDLSDL